MAWDALASFAPVFIAGDWETRFSDEKRRDFADCFAILAAALASNAERGPHFLSILFATLNRWIYSKIRRRGGERF